MKNLSPYEIPEELKEARKVVEEQKRAIIKNPKDSIAMHILEVWEEKVKMLETKHQV